jgi:hypothetical protein
MTIPILEKSARLHPLSIFTPAAKTAACAARKIAVKLRRRRRMNPHNDIEITGVFSALCSGPRVGSRISLAPAGDLA